jgi:tryptophan-rich sensory protein
LITLIWAMIAIPYLLWVSFATILQVSITYLNR